MANHIFSSCRCLSDQETLYKVKSVNCQMKLSIHKILQEERPIIMKKFTNTEWLLLCHHPLLYTAGITEWVVLCYHPLLYTARIIEWLVLCHHPLLYTAGIYRIQARRKKRDRHPAPKTQKHSETGSIQAGWSSHHRWRLPRWLQVVSRDSQTSGSSHS